MEFIEYFKTKVRHSLKEHNPLLWPFIGIYLFLLLTGRLELSILMSLLRGIENLIGMIVRLVLIPVSLIDKALPGLHKLILHRIKKPNVAKPDITMPSVETERLSLPSISLPSLPRPGLPIPNIVRFSLPLPSGIDIASFTLGVATALMVYMIFILYQWVDALPDPANLSSIPRAATTKIYDRNGTLIYEIYKDVNRTPIPLSEMPDVLKQATIAIEDKEFYTHPGISIRGIARAAYNISVNREIQGGSTLTQQLVKTVFFTPEQTIERKVKEIITAVRVEAIYSKDEILQMYLNQIPYGGTAYGVSAAADQYFNKSVQELTLSEAAFLAGLPAAPTANSPFGSDPDAYKDRQVAVLRRMAEDGYISREQAQEAAEKDLNFVRPETDIKAPHFAMYAREELERRFGKETVAQGGLKVITSVDLEVQRTVQEIVTEEIERVESLNIGNGAALVTKPDTGEIIAMVGSRDYFDVEHDGQVNVTTSLRQPGSSIKPITYATAFKKGFSPATILLDVPTEFRVQGQPPYRPKNYDGRFHGPQPIRYTLANSYNIPAVRMLATVGIQDMMDTAYELGITTFTDPSRFGLSLTLGGGEVRMTEMATAFGTFANLGRRQDLVSILKVTDNHGNTLYEYKPTPGPLVITPEIAYLISHILLDNNARTAAFGPNSLLKIPGHTVSVKTGTTDNIKDNWTIGYTPSLLTAVWVGNNDAEPMNRQLVSGVTGAAPIWNRIMRELLKDQPDEWPIRPEGIIGMNVCTNTGAPANNDCQTRYEYMIKDVEPPQASSIVSKTKLWVKKDDNKPTEQGAENAEEREVTLLSDPLTKHYCISCGFNTSVVDVSKIPSLPIVVKVDSPNSARQRDVSAIGEYNEDQKTYTPRKTDSDHLQTLK